MLQTILLVAIIIVAISLTGVVLLQRSEGGALGMGGGPSGFMTARGAGNLLTVITWWLAAILFALTIGLTVVGNMDRASVSVIDANAVGSLATQPQTQQQPAQPQPAAPARPTAPSLDDLEASLPSAPPTRLLRRLRRLPPSKPDRHNRLPESAPQGALSSFDQQFDLLRAVRRERIME